MPGAAVHGAVGRHDAGPRVRVGAGVDADHAAGVLVAARVRIGPGAASVVVVPGAASGRRRYGSGRARCRPARSRRSGCAPARSGGRVCARRTSRSAWPGSAAPGTAPVSASTPDGRSTATIGTPGVAGAGQPGHAVRQPGPPADAEHAVDDQVGAAIRSRLGSRPVIGESTSRRRPPAAPPARAACGVPEAADGGHRAPRGGPAGRRRTARRRRCCRADQDQHPGAVDRPRMPAAARRSRGQAAGGALHQRVVAHRRPSPRASRARIVADCRTRIARTQASQTTTAEAIPASWDRRRGSVATPSWRPARPPCR